VRFALRTVMTSEHTGVAGKDASGQFIAVILTVAEIGLSRCSPVRSVTASPVRAGPPLGYAGH